MRQALDRNDNTVKWFWVAMILLVCFVIYAGCQQKAQIGGINVPVTPVPTLREVLRVQAQPILLAPNPSSLPNRYYVINSARLYCAFITNELQYTGETIMKAWWDMIQPQMKQWYFNDCQR